MKTGGFRIQGCDGDTFNIEVLKQKLCKMFTSNHAQKIVDRLVYMLGIIILCALR